MTTGLLVLAAGELARATDELERWNPNEASRREARLVIGLLQRGNYRSEVLLRKWKARLGDVQTVKMEAQDISEGDEIHFPRLDVIHAIQSVGDSPVEEGFLRLQFSDFELDVDPEEAFDVVLSH